MYLVEQFKKLAGLDRYSNPTSITCNLDVLAHYVTSGKMPEGASKSEMEETIELMEKLDNDEVVFVYDRVSFSEAYIKLLGDQDLVVVRYALAPGWDSWKVNATNDLVDRLKIRNKVVTDKTIIDMLLDLPGDEKKDKEEAEKTEQVTSNLTYDWSAPAGSPLHNRRSTDRPANPVLQPLVQTAESGIPKPPITDENQQQETGTNDASGSAAQGPAPAPGDNQMAAAFREANRQRTGGSRRERQEANAGSAA